jgi:hypothetical protein
MALTAVHASPQTVPRPECDWSVSNYRLPASELLEEEDEPLLLLLEPELELLALPLPLSAILRSLEPIEKDRYHGISNPCNFGACI